MMARTGFPSLRTLSTAVGSRLKVAGSMSAKTGVAPQRVIELAEAKNVNGGVMARSPGLTPAAASASHNASVPEEQPTQADAPRYAADSRSKASSSGPPMKYWMVSTRSMAAATSSLMDSYCRLRSSMGTGSTLDAAAGEMNGVEAGIRIFNSSSVYERGRLAKMLLRCFRPIRLQ